MGSPQTATARKIKNIDALMGIRFLAAFGVVAHHFVTPYFKEFGPRVLYNISFSGQLAVPLFFILSGFVLQISWRRKRAENTQLKDFYFKRFIRIYPLFLFSLAVSANIAYNIIQQTPSLSTGILKIFSVVTLTQAISPSTKMLWNFPAWFLTPLLFSYILFPYISNKIFSISDQYLPKFWLGLCVLIFIIPITRSFFNPESAVTIGLYQFSPIFPVFYFILGIISCEIYSRHIDSEKLIDNSFLIRAFFSKLNFYGYASLAILIFIVTAVPLTFI